MGIIYSKKQLARRRTHEHYPTASGLVEAALSIPIIQQNTYHRVLDPGAGTGVWGAVARKFMPEVIIDGVELQPCTPCKKYNNWYFGDFFRYAAQCPYAYDLIIGNPPYGGLHRDMAELFIRMSLSMLESDGVLLFLLRSAFFEGQERGKKFFKEFRPCDMYQLSRRPSFTGNGKTDSTAYSVFVWNKGYHPEYTRAWHLDWDYGEPIEEDAPFRPYQLLVDIERRGDYEAHTQYVPYY